MCLLQQSLGDVRNRRQERRQTVAAGNAEGDTSHQRAELRLFQSAIRTQRSDAVLRYA